MPLAAKNGKVSKEKKKQESGSVC